VCYRQHAANPLIGAIMADAGIERVGGDIDPTDQTDMCRAARA
jgi:hypothetical protein